jgi:two-component sensor histidine kinase
MAFFTPDTSAFSDFYEKEKFKLAWRLSLSFSITFLLLTLVVFPISSVGSNIYLAVFLVSLASLIWLYFTKKHQAIFWIFTVTASVLVIFSINSILETLHYSDLLWIVNIILFAYIGLSKKEALFFVILHTLFLIYYVFCEMNTHISLLEERTQSELIGTAIEILFAFLIMVYLFDQNLRFQRYVQIELREANKELERKNTEITVLLKEVHHRVKNNLQIVVSLLRIQQNELENTDLNNQFQDAVNRIITISSIHEKLYQSKELSQLNFNNYVDSLIADFRELFAHHNISIHFSSDVKAVELKTVVPLGLILNELITNSIKHSNSKETAISIELNFSTSPNGIVTLRYDDGNEWTSEGAGFGLELIQALSSQIDGIFLREGSQVRIEFNSGLAV